MLPLSPHSSSPSHSSELCSEATGNLCLAMEDPDNKPLATNAAVVPTVSRDNGPQNRDDVLAIDATRDITIAEHEASFWVAVRQWPTAVFWAIFFCIAVVMAGFDAQIITSFFALPAFRQKFGYLYKGSYILSAEWQMALNMVTSRHPAINYPAWCRRLTPVLG